jgi:hypothetical protein
MALIAKLSRAASTTSRVTCDRALISTTRAICVQTWPGPPLPQE